MIALLWFTLMLARNAPRRLAKTTTYHGEAGHAGEAG